MINVIFATLHLFALVAGLSSIVQRAVLLFKSESADVLRRAFRADLIWGFAAGLWIITGLIRLFFQIDKNIEYYINSSAFVIKMALFILVIVLEVWPMIKLISFRKQVARGEIPDASACRKIGLISCVEAALVFAMAFFATAMARGY